MTAPRVGAPDPLDFRAARPIGRKGTSFGDGATITNGTPITTYLPIAGALNLRLRWLSTGAGTLSFAYVRPPMEAGKAYQEYAVGNPSNTAVVGGTEVITDIAPKGESILRVTFTPSANGTLTYGDVMQV